MSPPKPDTRERIVYAAFLQFLANGYAATGLADVTRAAGVHPGSLYHFFPTKEDLVLAVLEWCKVNLWPEVIQPVFDRVSDPIERVFGILDGYRKMLIMTEFTQGCPMGNLALELNESHPAVRELIAQNFTGWTNAVRMCLDEASGRFPEHVDAAGLSTFVLTTMEGAVMLARTYRSLEPYDQAVTHLRDYFDRLLADGSEWSAPRKASQKPLSSKPAPSRAPKTPAARSPRRRTKSPRRPAR